MTCCMGAEILDCKQDTIQPTYKEGIPSIMKYFSQRISPILSKCVDLEKESPPTSLHMDIVIDSNGKVLNVIFVRDNVSPKCKVEIKKEVLTMDSWTPAMLNGKSLKGTYHFRMSCILWSI